MDQTNYDDQQVPMTIVAPPKTWADTIKENKWIFLLVLLVVAYLVYMWWSKKNGGSSSDISLSSPAPSTGKITVTRMRAGAF
jgi:hypothetical protein